MRNIFTRRYERLWVRNGRESSFFLGSRWTQTWSYAAPKNYVAGPIQRHRVLTRSTGCRQQASRKFISRKKKSYWTNSTPRAIFLRHAHDQGFRLLVNRGAS